MMRKTQFLFLALIPWVHLLAFGQDHLIQFGFDSYYSKGNEQSFSNQYRFEEGFYLDQLKLDFNKSGSHFEVKASGIGDRPTQAVSFLFKKEGVGSFGLRYSKRSFDFLAPSYETGMREDQWSHTRVTAFMEYTGWDKLDLSVEANQWSREGDITRPVFGLGIPYMIRTQFDDQNNDFRIGLKTKNMPLKLRFEQIFSKYTRDDTLVAGQALIRDDDVLLEVESPGEDKRTSPSSFLSAYYESQRWAMELRAMIREDQTDIFRNDFSNYGLDDGNIGEMGFLHNVTADSEREATQLNTSFGFKLSEHWTLRLRYSGFDQTTENHFMELFQLIIQGPSGETVFESNLLDQSTWEKEDSYVYSQIEYRNEATRLALSWGEKTREITHSTLDNVENVERQGENLQVDISHRFSKTLTTKLGASIGDYSRFIFRIQPEEVNRYWINLKMGQRKGWAMSFKADMEDAANPIDQADLDRSQSQLSLNVSYTLKESYLSASVSKQSFSSEIALNDIPDNTISNLSVYDSELLFITVNASLNMGKKARLNLSASRSEDSGDSMPFRLTQLQSSLEFEGPFQTRHWFFIQDWSYRNVVYATEDYDMMRFGYKIGWRF